MTWHFLESHTFSNLSEHAISLIGFRQDRHRQSGGQAGAVDKVESFDEYGSGVFISGEVSEMMLGVGVRLCVYGVIGTCIGMFDDGHRIV